MPSYFNKFPKIYYDAAGHGNYKLVTNLLRRVQIKEGLKTQNAVIRKGFLVLLAEVAKSFTPTVTKQYPLLHLDLKHLFDLLLIHN